MLTANDSIEITSFSSVNLLGFTGGKDLVGIKVVTASAGASIVGKTAQSADTARTFTVASGEEIPVSLRTIDSVVNVTRVRIYW
jgi:hypothetical protein